MRLKPQVLRFLVGLLLGAVPVACVLWMRDRTGLIDIEIIVPGAQYPQALAQLGSTSESLVTISLSILAATAYLLFNRWPRLPWYGQLLGYLVFLANVIALYCGARLGYLEAISLAAESPDILPLASLLDTQALFTLLSAGILVTLAVVGEDGNAVAPPA